MTLNQQDFARAILRELVAEYDNGHLPLTGAVLWARTWVALDTAAHPQEQASTS